MRHRDARPPALYARPRGAVPERVGRKGDGEKLLRRSGTVTKFGELADEPAVVAEVQAVGESAHDENAASAFAGRIRVGLLAHRLLKIETAAFILHRGREPAFVKTKRHRHALVGRKLVAVLDGVAARLDQRGAQIIDGILREQKLAGQILHGGVDSSQVLEIAGNRNSHLLDLVRFYHPTTLVKRISDSPGRSS